MKRSLIVATGVVAAVAGASVAEAAVQTGTFKGKSTAGDPIGFTVPKKDRVADFYFQGVTLTCTDGDKFDTGSGSNRLQSPSGKRYVVSSKGKFTIKDHNDAQGNGWDAKGKFNSKGTTATGTLTVFANFDISNNPSPKGTVKCKSETLKFTVNRK
jgi:opacity protein-like surface antigen